MSLLFPGKVTKAHSPALIYGTAAGIFLLTAAPVMAGGASSTGRTCDPSQSFGNPACQSNAAPRAYERWQNGTSATESGSTNPGNYRPNYYRGYNALYGFGR